MCACAEVGWSEDGTSQTANRARSKAEHAFGAEEGEEGEGEDEGEDEWELEGEDGEGVEEGPLQPEEGEAGGDDWKSLGPFVGFSIRRWFPTGEVDGVVVQWLPPGDDVDDITLWRIEHADGDREDLDEAEVIVAVYAAAKDLHTEPLIADAEQWAEANHSDQFERGVGWATECENDDDGTQGLEAQVCICTCLWSHVLWPTH